MKNFKKLIGCLLFFIAIGIGSVIGQTVEPNTHPIQTACVAVQADGSETTVGYSNDCGPGGDGCVDNNCPGAGKVLA